MQFFRNSSLRRKQTLIIMFTTSVALLLACVAVTIFQVLSFRRHLTEDLVTFASVVGNNVSAALDFDDPKAAKETLAALKAKPDIIGACVYTPDGVIFAQYTGAAGTAGFQPPQKIQLSGHAFGKGTLSLFAPIKSKGEVIGVIYLETNTQDLRSQLSESALITAAVFAATLVISLLLSDRLQRLISEPILELVGTMRAVAGQKNYSLRVRRRNADEIGALIDGFNDMLAQIQERDANLERRVAERTAALRQSEALYSSLVEQLPAGVFRKNAEGRYVLVNSTFCRLKDMTPEQFLGKTPLELGLTDATLAANGADHHVRLMKTGKPIEVEEVYVRPDGSKLYFHVVKSPVFDPDGRIIGSQGILMDITARRRAEEAVRESQALYSSLVEQLPAGVFRKDVEGRYVLVNSWFCRFKGVTAELFLGKRPREVAAAELSLKGTNASQINQLASRGVEDHAKIIKTGKPVEALEEYRMSDGSTRHLRVIKSPVFNPDGQIIGSQGILFDVTETKRVEAELSYERNLLRALLENTDDSIYFKDRESRFIRCSATMAKRFQLPDEKAVMGKHDRDFYGTEHAEEAFADEQRIIRTGEPVIGKVERETWPDGHVTWVLTSKMPLRNEGGEIVGTFGVSKDITPIKEAEAKLDRIHKQLVEASRQAGMAEVATSVLHNVGNVLNSINVSGSLLADKLRNSKLVNLGRAAALIRAQENDLGGFFANDPRGKQLPGYLAQLAEHLVQEQREMLNEIAALTANIVHVKEIVSMQQSYAKASGVLEVVNVTELVEDALRMNEGAVKRHNIEIMRDFAAVPAIVTEKHKVLQILINVIRNAKYACDDSGRDDKRIVLRVANGAGRVKISVIDNGIGIPAENLTRIFSHGFTTRKEGHGFGLHSGALAAKEIGGTLTAASDGHQRGATFTLELPANPPN